MMIALRAFFLSLIAWIAILGALWLLPAGLLPGGTWQWRRGLWAVGLIGIFQAIGASSFAAYRPPSDNMREQGLVTGNDKKRVGWRDPLVDVLGMVYGAAFLVFIPLDVFRLHLLPRPTMAVSTAGGVASILGIVLMHASVAQHVAAPNAQDRSGQNQRVINTGLYGIVRHPMYLGALVWLSGVAIWLESFAALIACLGLFAFIRVRIAIEEAHLRKNLPGYVENARRVRSRLLPFVF